jgi:hypothetical protein
MIREPLMVENCMGKKFGCTLSLISLMFVYVMLLPSTFIPSVHAQTEVTITKHARLGFNATFTFNQTISDEILGVFGERLANYTFDIDGTANFVADMGVDITLTYDIADILPGQPLSVNMSYTPTDDPGPEFKGDASAVITTYWDVSILGYTELVIAFGIPGAMFLVDLDLPDELGDPITYYMDVAVGSSDFTAPLNGEPPVVVPMSSSTVIFESWTINVIGVSLTGGLTLSPVPLGDFADAPIGGGAGGAVAFLGATGANVTDPNPILGVPGFPSILEWGTAGETVEVTLQLPEVPDTIDLLLDPLLHWVETSANLDLNLDFLGLLDPMFGDKTINLFSDSLGPLYQQIGLNTTIGDAVAASNPLGIDPGVGSLVGQGNIPVPLLEPEIGIINATYTSPLGSLAFAIDLDSDDDGLMDGTEIAIGTDLSDSDSDDDGLTDGDEVNVYATDPLDVDSDDDGLIDGDEVNVYGTNPLDPDSDGDGLTDSDEVNIYATNPLNADTDEDGLTDGLEVEFGTAPLDPDTDDDGIPDGEDVEWLQNAIYALPDSAFKDRGPNKGLREAMIKILDDAELAIASNNIDEAIELLVNIRRHLDGCGLLPDRNDWIVDCIAQIEIRELIDIYIANLV